MKFMRKILDSKVFWLVVSVLISLSVWVYVTSVETVESTRTFRVRVDIVGEDALLNSRNMVVTDVDTSTVTIEIRGPRRVVNTLDDADLVAEADVSRLSQAAYTSLNYTIVYPTGTDRRNLTIVSRSKDTINFMVSKLTEKQIPVQGGFAGRVAAGYTAETPIFEPSTITVSGPEVYLKNIHHASVSFGEGQTVENTYSVEIGFELQDANNQPCSTTEISYDPVTIQATLPIMALKEVPLKVNILDWAGVTENDIKITYEPKSITLAGDSAVLAEINQIVLDTLDLSDFATEFTGTYPISYPNGLLNLTGVSEATITVQIVGLETKTFYLTEFEWIGLSEDQEIIPVSASVPVVIRGPASVLQLLQNEEILAEADLTNFKDRFGTYTIPLKITIPGYTNLGVIKPEEQQEYLIAITIERKEET